MKQKWRSSSGLPTVQVSKADSAAEPRSPVGLLGTSGSSAVTVVQSNCSLAVAFVFQRSQNCVLLWLCCGSLLFCCGSAAAHFCSAVVLLMTHLGSLASSLHFLLSLRTHPWRTLTHFHTISVQRFLLSSGSGPHLIGLLEEIKLLLCSCMSAAQELVGPADASVPTEL